MRHPSSLGDLTPDEWEYLQDKLDRFEQAWQQTDAVDLNRFLPPPGDRLRAVALGEFIKTDLEIRWRKRQTAVLEEYLKRFPEVAEDRPLLAQLVYEEFVVRQRHGDKPDLTTYRARFPEQFATVERLVQDQFPTAAALAPLTAPPGPKRGSEGGGVLSSVGGGYTLRKRIGAGSFGEVWRAEAPGGVDVAVKIITRPLDHAQVQRELESLELIKRLRHPFLVQTQAFWSSEDRLFIAMELADGSLRDRLRECYEASLPGIPPDELRSYFREASEALDYLHAKQVQHRDIKPDNILLLAGHAKVADFGLARMLENQRSFTATSSGTPAYMAPEVWHGRGSRHSDQYSLAATYAELRLNRSIFDGRDMMQIMLQHVEEKPKLEPLPQAEQQVLLKALAKKPAERYGSCLEFWQALHQALVSEGFPPKDRSEGSHVGAAAPTKEPHGEVTPRAAVNGSQEEVVPQTVRPGAMPVIAPRGAGESSATGSQPAAAKRQAPFWAATCTGQSPVARRRLLLGACLLLASALPIILIAWVGLPAAVRPGQSVVDFLPKGYEQADGAEIVSEKEQKLYTSIAYVLPDRTGIVFLLIRQARATDPPPFYIMQDKVSNKLFRAFVAAKREAVPNSEWELGGLAGEPSHDIGSSDDRLPVFRVTLAEVHEFARWIGGELPTARQWDKAAGRYDGAKGPFEGNPNDFKPGEIAVGRGKEGPQHVGTADRDRSLFGCRDMAGNGREWTCTIADPDPNRENARVPFPMLSPSLKIRLRGQSYFEERPYQFGPREDEQRADIARVDISFRVVIEPPLPP